MNWQVGLYVAAVLIPLAAFTIEILFIGRLKRLNAYIATGAIGLSCVLSAIGFLDYFLIEAKGVFAEHHAATTTGEHEASADAGHAEAAGAEHEATHPAPLVWKANYDWVLLGAPTAGALDRFAAKPLSFPLGVYIDSLSVIMFLMVTFIATLIHLYSIGYMHDDPRFPRFFAFLSLFCFSMLGLIASPNLFMIFIFWELVGLCSYLLIGFWYEEKSNADAANKAFVANRVGDVGMLIGLGLLWTTLGTFNFQEISEGLRDSTGQLHTANGADAQNVVDFRPHGEPVGAAPHRQIPYWMLTIAGLGIFAGCAGKSAQFPLHVWLPDAMAGPTPVSALIHAATMVAAGVYLVARFFPVFTSDVLLYIAYTGGVTLLIAATIAMVQTDYKKVLAYSTISQLGFMMLAIGVGGRAAGMFHLVTHAFFKALLFLGAGSVYHSVHTYEMPGLGGLRKKMPITATTMLIGTLAISGVPFFSGFYSKDAILAAAIARVSQSPQHFMLFVLPALGATITAFYMFRMWFLVFAGEARGFRGEAHAAIAHAHDEEQALAHEEAEHGHGASAHDLNPVAHAHESEAIMTRPLVILAFFSVFVGWTVWAGLPFGVPVLESLIAYGEPAGVINAHWAHWYAVGCSLAIGVIGIGLGALYYAPVGLPYFPATRLNPGRTAAQFRGLHTLFKNKWYFDDVYRALLINPCLAFARLCGRFDKLLIDGMVNGAAWATERLSRLNGLFDKLGVDGAVNALADLVYVAGDRSRAIQTGKLRNYLMFLAVALVGLFAGVFAWVGG
ncbi:NADH-quinone oxidoreductase subunit L [Paludisphaera borealis]|uniref:NADH-quinone oxidoreductase subunit L n=1 Tax=Paludisphaera borealis TaxID=1387353 RepID=A0A1U7CPW5_9BACT|nr:NADH-quinone oxidoreductase subunit L [Paludisphaera borealis]APW60985.1 NADH-quinone oxidoreductase subunit L [Paludisphaera borealis]